ncbi:MAG: ribulose-phosphate 3-epimerase [Clostridia bacterium]|nr:ribulose-phosphate 3-epimerase [Clostridia bacterium]
MLLIAPSILAADPLNLERDTRLVAEAGCDWLHVDVMDAHFVSNLSFGPDHVEALHRRFPSLPLDVHLMMDSPQCYIRRFADSGADGLTVHAEIEGDVFSLLQSIRDLGCRTGLALRPATPVERVRELLPLCDLVLVMTVEPGYGGQHLIPETLHKIPDLRRAGFGGLIEADGGIGEPQLPELIRLGLDVAVMGTAVFRHDDPARMMAEIRAMSGAE